MTIEVRAVTIHAHGVKVGDYFDNSGRAQAVRNMTAYRIAERDLVQSFDNSCDCGMRVCTHSLDRLESAISALRAQFGL